MKVVENVVLEGGSITLDDTLFIDCKFTKVVLMYSGGEFSCKTSMFNDCPFFFTGPAGHTLRTLQAFGWGDISPDGNGDLMVMLLEHGSNATNAYLLGGVVKERSTA